MRFVQDDREGQNTCTATGTGKHINPCARNTFILTKYVPEKLDVSTTMYGDDVLHYGQKVHLVAHPSVQKLPIDSSGGPKPLRLFSKQMSTTHYSKYTRQQVRVNCVLCMCCYVCSAHLKLLVSGTAWLPLAFLSHPTDNHCVQTCTLYVHRYYLPRRVSPKMGPGTMYEGLVSHFWFLFLLVLTCMRPCTPTTRCSVTAWAVPSSVVHL